MRKSLGNKRNEITPDQIKEITRIYGDFKAGEYKVGDADLEVKIFKNEDFGYNKVTVLSPAKDEDGKILHDKKGNKILDKERTDSEIIPLGTSFSEYMEKNVLPFNPDAWIDESKTKVGYEIPFTRHFYKYVPPKPAKEIFEEIKVLEFEESKLMKELFGE